MTSKNGSSNGATDPIGDSVEKVLRLYDKIRSGAQKARATETVEVPEWDVSVTVQALSADDLDYFEGWYGERLRAEADRAKREDREPEPMRGSRAMAVALCVIDPESKEKVFSPADAEWLGRESALAVARIFVVADRLSGLSAQARADLQGNSGGTDGAANSSVSVSA